MKVNCTINQKREIELISTDQQAFPSQAESLSSPTDASKNFRAAHAGVEEFHQTNQDTFIWLLAVEVAIS
jgi:hypothetical protein